MYRSEVGTRLPNTLMLGAFLRRFIRLSEGYLAKVVAEDRREKLREAIRERAVIQFDRFAEKFRDGLDYTLLSESQVDPAKLSQALRDMGFVDARGVPVPATFVSRKRLIEDELAGPTGRRRMEDLLDLATTSSLRHWLNLGHLSGLVDMRYGERGLENVVSLSLGSQRLLAALDTGFGYPFAHVFKDDIVAFWTSYVGHALLGDAAAMRRMGRFADVMRQTFPIARLDAGTVDPITGTTATEPVWIFMVD